MSFPLIHPLGTLRLAQPSDIMRIGIVATESFRHSPVFRWERPYHECFPEDTLLAYRKEFTNALKSEDKIVLVVEDAFIPNENAFTKASMLKDNGWKAPAAGEKVVVGVMSFKLESGSAHIGQLRPNDEYPDLPSNPERDLNREHYGSFGASCEAIEKRYFTGFSQMDMLCVHPAYWRKGHGTQLVKWTLNLARMDGITQGVNAAPMGARLYEALGYEIICIAREEGDEDDPLGVYTYVFKFGP